MLKNQHDFDVIILGGGLVGASLALSLQLQDRRVLLLEKKWPQTDLAKLSEHWDARIYAINPANQAFLTALGVWSTARAQPVIRMDVRGDQGGRIEFNASEAKVPYLNQMVENRFLLAQLWQRLQQAGVEILTNQVCAVRTDIQSAQITLDNGQQLTASLLVGADGAHSWLRQQLGIHVKTSPYQHQGLVANFQTEQPHHGCAYQWFKQGEILAYLPLPEQQISIVWSTARAQYLRSLPLEELARAVALQGEQVLGNLMLNTDVFAFDLILRQPETTISQRTVLVGDAAHTIHPLAGQGVNLGLADVQCLHNLLMKSKDLGAWAVLKQYHRSRLFKVRSMQQGCDGLFKLFANDQLSALSWLRNRGLSLVNQMTPIKNKLMQQAMNL